MTLHCFINNNHKITVQSIVLNTCVRVWFSENKVSDVGTQINFDVRMVVFQF